MNKKTKIVVGTLVAYSAYLEVLTLMNHRRFSRNLALYEQMKKERDEGVEIRNYLLAKLDQYQVPVTPFDDIALNTIHEKHQ